MKEGEEQGAVNKMGCSLPGRRSFEGARVAPQRCPILPRTP